MKPKPFTAAQLEALRSQRLNGLANRLLASLEIARAERDRLAGDLERMRSNLGELERARPDREKVLAVVHGSGRIDVIGEEWTDARVINLAKVPEWSEPLMTMAEEIAEFQLPGVYRELWQRNPKPRATGNVNDCRTPADLYANSVRLQVHAIADRLLKKVEALK